MKCIGFLTWRGSTWSLLAHVLPPSGDGLDALEGQTVSTRVRTKPRFTRSACACLLGLLAVSTSPALPGPVRRLIRTGLRTNLYVACGVMSLGAWVARTEGLDLSTTSLVVLGCGTLFIYNLDHLRDDQARMQRDPRARPRLSARARVLLLVLALLGLTAAFVLGPPPLLLSALPAGLIGLAYGAGDAGRRLKDLPGAKSWLVAAAVSQAVLLVPRAGTLSHMAPSVATASSAALLFILCALNAHCFDLRDVETDAAAGATTWATRLGSEGASQQLHLAAWTGATVASVASIAGVLPWGGAATLVVAALSLRALRPNADSERFGLLVDGWLFVPLLTTLVP